MKLKDWNNLLTNSVSLSLHKIQNSIWLHISGPHFKLQFAVNSLLVLNCVIGVTSQHFNEKETCNNQEKVNL